MTPSTASAPFRSSPSNVIAYAYASLIFALKEFKLCSHCSAARLSCERAEDKDLMVEWYGEKSPELASKGTV